MTFHTAFTNNINHVLIVGKPDDWGISEDLFLYVDSLWGPHEIDWFANDDNHKLPVFHSRYWNVKSIGIDAFTVDWGGVNGLFVPPVCLLFKVLQYMKQCRACIRKVNNYTMKFNLKANILKGKSILPNTDFLPLPGI
jgi:hypothetical protein